MAGRSLAAGAAALKLPQGREPGRIAAAILLGGAAAALGALLYAAPLYAVAAAGLFAGLAALGSIGHRAALAILVAATFANRIAIPIGDVRILAEHVAVLGLVLVLVREGHLRRLWNAATRAPVVILAFWIAWQAVISLWQSPEPIQSLEIVAWLAVDWLIVVAILASIRDGAQLERWAVIGATFAAVAAIVIWIAASAGFIDYGLQETVVGGATAVYGLSFEANILASSLAVWLFVALTSKQAAVRRISRLFVPVGLTAMVLTLTRATIIALVLGFVIWMLFGGLGAVRRLAVIGLSALAVVLVVVLIVPQVSENVLPRATNVANLSEGTGAYRVETIELAIDDLSPSALLFGLGTNSFSQRHIDPTRPGQGEPRHMGNLPMQLLYDGGLVGVGLMLVFFLSLQPLRGRSTGRALGVTAVYLTAALATSPLWLGFTWVLVALAIATIPRAGSGTRGPRPPEVSRQDVPSRTPSVDRSGLVAS